QTAAAPDHRARSDQLTVVPAVEHRSARQYDRRNVDGARRHDLARRGLVAAGSKHHAVDGIAIEQLDQPKIKQVAIERGGGPAAILEDRVHREFYRYPARVADAVAHALGEIEVYAVARREIAARLRDADDRLA